MPTIQALSLLPNTTITEPVSLDLLRQWVRVDGEGEDALLLHLLSAAREKVEAYTGRYFAGGQRLAYTFDLSEPYQLPEGAAPESVSGFFTNLETLEAWNAEEYRKGISVNRELYLGEALNQSYTVVATLPAQTYCPELAKSAILELSGEWYRNRESSSVGTISPELPVAWRVKLAELRVMPL